MKQIIILFILFLSFTFCSCNNESENEIQLPVSLSQTIWKGDYIDKETKVEYKLKVAFYNDEVGHYSYGNVKEKDVVDFEGEYTFFYKIVDKIIYINVINDDLLANDWWIVKYNGKNMNLSTMPGDKSETVIKLKKVY